jgi:hypothetical protein
MKTPEELSREELVQIVGGVQQVLWLDHVEGQGFCFVPDKEWESDTIEHVAQVLADHDLRPSGTTPFENQPEADREVDPSDVG